MPRGIKWDYSLYIELHSLGNTRCWTQYIGRQKSGVFWIGSFSWEAEGSWSCETPGDFLDEIEHLPHCYVNEFYRYFLTNQKYQDVATMMQWCRKDIRVHEGGNTPKLMMTNLDHDYPRS